MRIPIFRWRAQHRFAARDGKKTLYKFRAFTTAREREWVREIIAEHKVYFSRASQLNDPFDLAPVIRITSNRKRLLAGAERAWSRRNPSHTPEELERVRERVRTGDLDNIRREGEARARSRMECEYWVFSLAGNREHPMLWSHYAQGHTGLCIHFSAIPNSPFGGAQRVVYARERPVLDVPFTMPEHEVAEALTLTKGRFWRYEDEYRFLRYPDLNFEDFGLKFNGQHAHFHPRLITGITVGARMPQLCIERVRHLAASSDPPLPIWQARERETYTFTFERI